MAFLPLAGRRERRHDLGMQAEVVLYDGFDELDALAPWEVLDGVAKGIGGLDIALVSLDGAAPITASHGTVVHPHRALSERPDLLIVPGGGWSDGRTEGARAQVDRGDLPRAIAQRHAAGTLVASVCTGAMLLAAAGLLEGRPAITHHSAIDDLEAAGARVVRSRVVDDGDIVTAGGVTSGLDLILWLVERFFGAVPAAAAERELEYERRGVVWRAAAGAA
jgi:transcriptional regulator GlxA family with amidase domain